MKQLYAAVAALLLSAWSAAALTETKVAEKPPTGEQAQAEVGQAIYQRIEYTQADARLEQGYNKKYGLGKIRIQAGAVLAPTTDKKGRLQYCSKDKVYRDPMAGPTGIACFVDDDGEVDESGHRAFEKVRIPTIKFGKLSPIKGEPLGFSFVGKEGFRQELVYSGSDGNSLKMVYREYSGGLARTAFSQEVTFTLENDGTAQLSFRGARIEVHEVGNAGMVYTVQRGIEVR